MNAENQNRNPRARGLVMALGATLLAPVGCEADPVDREGQERGAGSGCIEPVFSTGSSNPWWREFETTEAYDAVTLEVDGGATYDMEYRWEKWVHGGVNTPEGTRMRLHATTAAGGEGHTEWFTFMQQAPSAAVCSQCDGSSTYDARTDAVHGVGGDAGDGWNIWSNGSIYLDHDFGYEREIVVTARGQLYGNEAPRMRVTVDGAVVGEVDVDSTSYREYALPVGELEGVRRVEVSFLNDYAQGGNDRNLIVQSIALGCGGGGGGDGGPTCSDGVRNQGEAGVDCGGPCGPCGDGSGAFNYGEAMQKAIVFFGANQLGELSPLNRFEWRHDAVLYEGQQVGRDLSGGYADAGDNILFGKNMGITLVKLAWTAHQLEDAVERSGQMPALLDALKHGTDWIVNKAHIRGGGGETQELFVQLSDSPTDHYQWRAMEEWTDERPVYSVSPARPGSDVAALFSAALSSASLAFRGRDDAYADRLLDHSRALYRFATSYRGLMQDQVNTVYKNFNGDTDELSHAAAWLYMATGEGQYLSDSESFYGSYYDQWSPPNYEHSELAAGLLLAIATGKSQYRDMVAGFLGEFDTSGGFGGAIRQAPNGFNYFVSGWGSFGQSMATAFLAAMYADAFDDTDAADIAMQQLDFVLGDNPMNRSFMGGFGHNYPKQFHHRNASGGTQAPSGDNAHVLVGGVPLGIVEHDTDFQDQRDLYRYTEITTSLNASVVGALAYLYAEFGGQPLSEAELSQVPGLK